MIKLISIDLFETLVDLSGDRHSLWQRFLGDDASVEQTDDAWNCAGQLVYQALDHVNATAEFKPLHRIFHYCFSEIFHSMNIPFDPENATQQIIDYHAQRPWFPEARPWLDIMENQCRVCLSSDTDHAMIGEHVREYPFDECFTSQDLGFYKGDEQNRFFDTILLHYHLDPEEIIHVGDSQAEILAAKRVGIKTCWVNRNGQSWSKSQLPDYEVSSLDQITELLI